MRGIVTTLLTELALVTLAGSWWVSGLMWLALALHLAIEASRGVALFRHVPWLLAAVVLSPALGGRSVAPPRVEERMRVRGVIRERVRCREGGCQGVVGSPGSPGGVVLASFPGARALRPGDVVEMSGFVTSIDAPANPEEFNGARYFGRRAIQHRMKASEWVVSGAQEGWSLDRTVGRWRFLLAKGLEHSALSPSHRAVACALVLGDLMPLDDQVRAPFSATGIAHLLAVSGLHLACVAGAVYVVLLWLLRFLLRSGTGAPRRWASVGMVAVAMIYMELTGRPTSCVRAFVMLSGAALSQWFRRSYDLWTWLAVSSLILMALVPGAWEEAAFQLSIASVAGIAAGSPTNPPQDREVAPAWKRWLSSMLRVSMSAWGATLPFAWWHFGSIPLAAPWFNVVAVPIGSLLVLPLSLLVTLVSLVNLGAGAALSYPLEWSMDLLDGLTSLAGGLSPPLVAPWPGALPATLLGGAILLAVRWDGVWRATSGGLALVLLLFLVAGPSAKHREGCVLMHVGEGDCFVAQTACGSTLMVDGGRKGSGSRVIRPFLRRRGIQRIEWLFLSHGHDDHYGGIEEIASELAICHIVSNGSVDSRLAAGRIADLSQGCSQPTQVHRGRDGEQWVECGVSMRNLWVGQEAGVRGENDRSMVLHLGTETEQWMLTGDAEGRSSRAHAELAEKLRSTGAWMPDRGAKRKRLLKAPHHGHASRILRELVASMAGDVVVVPSTGRQVAWGVLTQLSSEKRFFLWVTGLHGSVRPHGDPGNRVLEPKWQETQ